MIYLDNSATTRVDPAVAEIMLQYMTEMYGNPSSIHRAGLIVHSELDKARQTTASLINCAPQEIIYMASGSEADNFAIIQTAQLRKKKGKHIITSIFEHKAILNTCAFLAEYGYEITYLPVDSKGKINIDDLKAVIRPDTILISIMLANNEVGTLQPVKAIAEIARQHDILIHTDAVQATGKMKLDVDELGVDMLTFSGHKIYAPKGIGVLFVREELKNAMKPLIHGGGQEAGKRAGTENIPYIMGLAKACEQIINDDYNEAKRIKKLRDRFEQRILAEIPDTRVNGDTNDRVCSITNITFKYIEAEALIGYVPEVCCSLGSACTAGQDAASHVLTAMNMDPVEIRGTVRFSFGKFNTEAEIEQAADYMRIGIEKLRAMSPLYKK